ncbi:hypothetical protein M422DRAFT_185882 [Sphaerobolus stellatus SS14]|uniref:DUF2470 domain-containing protein n=1 Tax=Sphaerobolus stellatus (strain SS14) TaxID=990650 RepID=A0A0C9UQV5_SPHS4|nr:hypothetical protein M422DRAFT_185882 [Sphaerobolus stellatus SS14]
MPSTSSFEKGVSIKFDPPLAGYEEVKPRLLGMKLDAEESLSMISLSCTQSNAEAYVKRPPITTFELRREAFITLFAVAFLLYVTFSYSQPTSTIWNFGPWLRDTVGPTSMKLSCGVAIFLHSLEALYVASVCKRHSTGLLKWTFATFFLGYPALRRLRALVHKGRIDSIQKIH